jgi:Sec-independent protein translocase protein TatA
MPTLAQANVEITARTGKYKASIAGVRRQTEGFGKSATKSLRNVTLGLTALGAAATVAAAAVGVKLSRALIRAGRESVLTAVKYDKLTRGLTAVAGSSEEAQRQLDRLARVAELPGLSFQQAIQGSINLQAAGLSAELSERALKAFGNALVTVGKGSEDLGGVNLALTQIANKTSGFGQDIRQLQERLPQMQTALRNAFDGKPLEDLEITGKELVAVLVAEFEKLPRAAGGVANSLENLNIAFDRLKAEVGKIFLDITKDTTDGLTGIVDTLREIIPFWKNYQDQVGVVMGNIVTLAVEATGAMFTEMAALIIKLSPVIWKPLWFGFKQAMLGIDDAGARLTGKIMRRLGVISQETFEREMKKLEDSSKEISEKMAENFRVGFQKSVDEAVAATKQRLPVIISEWQKLLTGIQSNLDTLKNTIPESIPLEEATKSVFDFEKAVGKLDLSKPFEGFQKTFSQFRIEQFGERLAEAFRNAGRTSDAFKESVREAMEAMQQQSQDAIDTIQPAFENLFSNLLSGNTKSLWAQFWDDLKRIAISRLASIFAGQLLGGIFGGGGGIGGLLAGGSLLAGLGPIAPAAIGAAGVLGPLLGRAGGFLEGNQGGSNTFIFNETNFANMDKNRLQKTVSQAIAPALAENAVDGR